MAPGDDRITRSKNKPQEAKDQQPPAEEEKKTPPPPPKRKLDEHKEGNTPPKKKKTPPPKRTKLAGSKVIETLAPKHPSAAGLPRAEINRKIRIAKSRARARGRDLPVKGLSRVATQSTAKYHHSDAKYGGTTPEQTSFFPEIEGATTDGTFRPLRTSGAGGAGTASQPTVESPTTQAAHDLEATAQLQSEYQAFQRADDAYRHAPVSADSAQFELNHARRPPSWPGLNQLPPPTAVPFSSSNSGGSMLPSLRNAPVDSLLPQETPYFDNKPGHGSPFVRDQLPQQQQQQSATPQAISAQRAMTDFAKSRGQGEIHDALFPNSPLKKSTPKTSTPKSVQFNEDVKTNDGPGALKKKRKAEAAPEREEDESSVPSDEDETFTSSSPVSHSTTPNPTTPEGARARFQQAAFGSRGGISRPTFSSMRPAQSQAPQASDEGMFLLPSEASAPDSPPTPELPARNVRYGNLESPGMLSPFTPAPDYGLGLPEYNNSGFHPKSDSPMLDRTPGDDTLWEELINLSSPTAASTPAATRRKVSTGVDNRASKLASVENAASEPEQTSEILGDVNTISNPEDKNNSTSGAEKSVKRDQYGPVDDNVVIGAIFKSPRPAKGPEPNTCEKRCEKFKAERDAMEKKYLEEKHKSERYFDMYDEQIKIRSGQELDQTNAQSRDAANNKILKDEIEMLRGLNASFKPQLDKLEQENAVLQATVSALTSAHRSDDGERETILRNRVAELEAEVEELREIAEVIQAVIVDDEDVPGDQGASGGQAAVLASQTSSAGQSTSPNQAASSNRAATPDQASSKDLSGSDMNPNDPYEDTDDLEASLGVDSDSSSGNGDDDDDDDDDKHPAKQGNNDRRPPGGGGGGAPGGEGGEGVDGGSDDDKSSGRRSGHGRGAECRSSRKSPGTSSCGSQSGSDEREKDSVDNYTPQKDISLLMFSRPQLETAHKLLNSKHEKLQSDYRELQRELEGFQTLQGKYRELQSNNQHELKRLQNIERELRDRQAKEHELKECQDIQDLRALRDIIGVNDDERNSRIVDKLQSLDGRVRELASRLGHARAVMPAVEETTKVVKKGKQTKKTPVKSEFGKLAEETCADWMSFCQAGSWQNLIHAVMWKHLEDQLFDKPFEYWAKQFGGHISKLLTVYTTEHATESSRSSEADNLRVPRANVCRALLAQMLHDRNSDQNKNTGVLSSGLAKLLASIFPRQPEISIDIKDASATIIDEAVEVMALLAQSPAHYELNREFSGLRRNLMGDRLPFDGASMTKKAENATNQAGVDVVMCPALVRRGPVDGLVGSYEDQTLVGRATVTADGDIRMTDAYEDYSVADDEPDARGNQLDNRQANEDATNKEEVVEEKTEDAELTPIAPETPGLRRSTRAPKKPKRIIDPDETDA